MTDDLPAGIEVEDGDVRFAGDAGRRLLLAVLLRAKFSTPYTGEALANPWIAKLTMMLGAQQSVRDMPPGLPRFADDAETRLEIAQVLFSQGQTLGWWSMQTPERQAFIRDVIAAPHDIAAESVEEIILAVEDEVARARRLVAQADKRTLKS